MQSAGWWVLLHSTLQTFIWKPQAENNLYFPNRKDSIISAILETKEIKIPNLEAAQFKLFYVGGLLWKGSCLVARKDVLFVESIPNMGI